MTTEGLRLSLPGGGQLKTKRRRLTAGMLLLTAVLCAALLGLLPAARSGFAALMNAVMDASEAVNAYAYRRMPETSAPDGTLAGALLAGMLLSLAGAAALRFRKTCGLAAAAACAGIQIYFGLSLPAPVNIAVFTLCGIAAADRITLRKALCIASAAVLLAGITAVAWHGTDEATEAASEHVRDLLEQPAGLPAAGSADREPDTIRETHHTDTRELAEGDREAQPDRQYRLITIEEEEISRPEWIDYLKAALLLLAAAAAVILPFIPAAAMNRRRKKAREARALFTSPNRNEAICAMFRHTAKYLEKTGRGAGNRPFRDWPDALEGKMPEKYVDSFRKCCILFEEAAYSDHEMTEMDAGEVRGLLAETERLLYDQAGRRQRLRLRYMECLHE